MRRLLLAPLLFTGFAQAADPIAIDVYRDPNCGCCKAWIEHLEDNGFAVADHVVNDMTSVKMEHGVPHRLGSCHTGVIDGTFVEGTTVRLSPASRLGRSASACAGSAS